jgi:DNA-binding response OmpR family regulator
MIREAITVSKIPAEVHVVTDGEAAIRFLEETAIGSKASPSLVLLDLNVPRRSGAEVLKYMRDRRWCEGTRVVIVTSSDSERDRRETADLGAHAYFRKPSTYEAYVALGEVIRRLLETPSEAESPEGPAKPRSDQAESAG